MKNLEWLYENDGYLNSFAKLMALVDGHATDSFTANEWLMAEYVAVSTTPLKMPSEIKWQYSDGEWTAEVGAPKLQNSQSDASKSEETDEIGASKCEIRDFDDEHAEGRFTDFGRTSDSREKLEAAVQTAAGYIYGRGFTNGLADAWNDDEVDTAANQIIQLLDRQAAITRAELVDCANCPITERNAKVIAELREQLDETKHAIAKAGGTWTEDDDGAVAVVFAPDMDKLLAELEATHRKNHALKAHISKMQNRWHVKANGWHAKVKELQDKVDGLTAERDDLKEDNRRYEHDCELLWQEKRELTAQRDKLREELRIEREAVEACEGCSKVNKLQAKLDALKRAVSDAGGMWMEEGGTVTAAFAPDVDELRAERDELRADLEVAHAKNRVLKAHIGKMQNGRHGWHVKAKELQEQVDSLTAELDYWRDKCGKMLDVAHEIRRIAE